MPTFAERQEIGLEQKLAALALEFDHWLKVSEADQAFEKHHTQVRAITGHLEGLRKQTVALLAEAVKEGTVLGEGRNIESLALGIRRIWEFFRAKLIQRHDDGQRGFLQIADELAWGCYKPVLDQVLNARREPPLVFLNGGLSPFALSRDDAFPAEAVPGEPLGGRTYDDILDRLPIPIIGVPWHQTAHLPDLAVVAHETGHAVEHDFGLHNEIEMRIKEKLAPTAGQARTSNWIAWSSEIFADAWGCLALGPAYASALRDFLLQSPVTIQEEVATGDGKYPTATLRILLCARLLETTFAAEAKTCREGWLDQYPSRRMESYEIDLPLIAEAVALPKLWSTKAAFGVDDWKAAGDAADEVKARKLPESANSAARLVAAARRLYDDDPRLFAAKKLSDRVMERAKELVKPGTRAGETSLTPDEKKALSASAEQKGTEAFNAFKAWCGLQETPSKGP